MVKHTLSLLIAALAMGFAGTAAAQWQWVDDDGRKVYSDRPPPTSVPQERILQSPRGVAAPVQPTYGPPPSAEAAEPAEQAPVASQPAEETPEQQAQREKEEAEQRAHEEQQAEVERLNAEAAQRNAEVRKTNCANARSRLAQLEPGRRITTVDAQGNAGFMDDATRAAERERAQQAIQSNC